MRKKLFTHSKRLYKTIIVSILILIISLIVFFLSFYIHQDKKSPPEILYLREKKMDFNQYKNYFQTLAKNKGAEYAFRVLERADLPLVVDLHLLGHFIGDELFKQMGSEGMSYCTDALRNACSHAIVINLFYQKGVHALEEIACQTAPGHANSYRLCYHGLGHGVFAYAQYDLAKTIELCKKTATKKHHGLEYPECIGGAVMEQISGGDHNKEIWRKQRLNNLNSNNPLNICYSLISDPEARIMCLSYLTPYLLEIEGKNSLIPSDQTIQRAFNHCNTIPLDEHQNRFGCYGGFGKEFTPLAKNKDIRNIETLTTEEIKNIYHWCLLSPAEDGQKYCIYSAQKSIYWSGAVDKKYLINFCNKAPSHIIRDYCFEESIETVKISNKNILYYLNFCSNIPGKFYRACVQELVLVPYGNLLLKYFIIDDIAALTI